MLVISNMLNINFLILSFFCSTLKRWRKYKKKKTDAFFFDFIIRMLLDYFLPRLSSDTVSFFLPFALRAASTLRPLAVDILSLNPCLCLRLVLEGWYVLFILLINYRFYSYLFFGLQKYTFFLFNNTLLKKYFSNAVEEYVYDRQVWGWNQSSVWYSSCYKLYQKLAKKRYLIKNCIYNINVHFTKTYILV